MAQVSQLDAVREIMHDQQWRTLARIRQLLMSIFQIDVPNHDVETSLRDLRKVSNGSNTVEKRHIGQRIYEYRVIPSLEL